MQCRSRPRDAGLADARRAAADLVDDAPSSLDEFGEAEVAARRSGLGEVFDALAQTSPASTRQQTLDAAWAFERATRWHTRAERADHRGVRQAARGIVRACNALGRGEDGGATAMLLSTLVLAAVAAAHWHAARRHAQQAAAAQQAAQHLRGAYQTAARTPMRAMREHGRRLPAPDRNRHASTVESVLRDRTEELRSERAFDALLATLDQAHRAGHDTEALLQRAVAHRELRTAESVSEVLVWRMRRLGDLPAHQPRLRTTAEPVKQQPRAARPQTAAPAQAPGRPEYRRRR